MESRERSEVKYFGEDSTIFLIAGLHPGSRGRGETYEIMEATPQPPRLILRLKGIETIEQVEPLIGKEILIDKDSLPKLERGSITGLSLDESRDGGRERGLEG